MKKRDFYKLFLIFVAFTVYSCTHSVGEPELYSARTLRYNNLSDHALHLEFDQFHGMNLETGKPFVQENVFSLDVPAHSSVSKNVMMGWGYIDITEFCSCRVTYDDGKVLVFEKESQEDLGSTYSPLYIKYYTTIIVDVNYLYSFEFTEELYLSAE